MNDTATKSDKDIFDEHRGDRDPPRDIARELLIRGLAEQGGRAPMIGVKELTGAMSSGSLARIIRESALDGLVRVRGRDLELTSLGQRAARSL